MKHFDLHCDTLSRCARNHALLAQNDGDISLERGNIFDCWVQAFACFIGDDDRGDAAYQDFLNQAAVLELTVEYGAALGGKTERIAEFARMGVKIFSLVWNGENELAGGVQSEIGLTELGREAVKELEKNRIIIDVSHLNTLGFWDLCEIAERPFIASHSNCFEVCPHKRNLDDLQIQEIIRRKGLIGINFFPIFINGESDASFQEIRRHIRHILSLGGEDVLAVRRRRPQPGIPHDPVSFHGYPHLFQSGTSAL